jgi:hypothetical protein
MLLNDLTMASANFGNGAVYADILEDWFRFIGGKPGEVVVIDGGSDLGTQEVYWALLKAGKIDKLQVIRPEHPDNHKDKCIIQEYFAGALASKPYILFVKMDTLPFRVGHEDWLEEAIGYLERPDVFAVSGAANYDIRHQVAWPGWYYSRKCSLNFALMKRSHFMVAMHEFAHDYIMSGFTTGNPLAGTAAHRYVVETAFERYMERHGRYTLTQEEDADWVVAHTNLCDDALARARARFYEGKAVTRYLERRDAARQPFAVYYGQPEVTAIRRLRIAFGRSALGPWWRWVKQQMTIRLRA